MMIIEFSPWKPPRMPMLEWNKPEDITPNDGEWILFYDGEEVNLGIYHDKNFINPDISNEPIEGVTYWMSLPRPPTKG